MSARGKRPISATGGKKTRPVAEPRQEGDGTAGKLVWPPGNMVIPAPAALVSCQVAGERPNLITIAWCGNINTNPPMLSISVRPMRHSHGILVKSGEFVLNLPSLDQAEAVDYCGVVSGKNVDKFAATGLTPTPIGSVWCPAVAECPVNIACRVADSRELGSHTLFLAEVTEINVAAGLVDRTGCFRAERANLLCYAHGFYFALGARQGHFGWSVRKKGRAAGRSRAKTS